MGIDFQIGGGQQPFTALHFDVRIVLGSGLTDDGEPLVQAAFAECEGPEVSVEIKTVRGGGENGTQRRLAGPLSFGNVTLKRGMTRSSRQLWSWVLGYGSDAGLATRATVVIRSWAPLASLDLAILQVDLNEPQYTMTLRDAVPVKLKAPSLHARENVVAIEELQLAFTSMEIEFKETLGDALAGALGGG